ncbi:hypothetical protein AAFF_G00408340 [Aldrovandia affinis]|uniref:Uncharacterized protein n=1 Tax=Aldrovandia affinis TaxID=143900 RepID=A0AAD7SBW0_9TELE|nr:hypothetical protein AAFF_G00408340 [Aldrovandia affinis]
MPEEFHQRAELPLQSRQEVPIFQPHQRAPAAPAVALGPAAAFDLAWLAVGVSGSGDRPVEPGFWTKKQKEDLTTLGDRAHQETWGHT